MEEKKNTVVLSLEEITRKHQDYTPTRLLLLANRMGYSYGDIAGALQSNEDFHQGGVTGYFAGLRRSVAEAN